MTKKIDIMQAVMDEGTPLLNGFGAWNSAIHNAHCSENLRRIAANIRIHDIADRYIGTGDDASQKAELLQTALRALNSKAGRSLLTSIHRGTSNPLQDTQKEARFNRQVLTQALSIQCGLPDEPESWQHTAIGKAISIAGIAIFDAIPGNVLFESMLTAVSDQLQLPLLISNLPRSGLKFEPVFQSLADSFKLTVTKITNHFYTGLTDQTPGTQNSCGMHSMNQLFAAMSVFPVSELIKYIREHSHSKLGEHLGLAALVVYDSLEERDKDLLSFYIYQLDQEDLTSGRMQLLDYLRSFKQLCHAIQNKLLRSYPIDTDVVNLDTLLNPLPHTPVSRLSKANLSACEEYIKQTQKYKSKFSNAKQYMETKKNNLRSYEAVKKNLLMINSNHKALPNNQKLINQAKAAYEAAKKVYSEAKETFQVVKVAHADLLDAIRAQVQQEEVPVRAEHLEDVQQEESSDPCEAPETKHQDKQRTRKPLPVEQSSPHTGFTVMSVLGFVSFTGFGVSAMPFLVPSMLSAASSAVSSTISAPGFFAGMLVLAAVGLACGIAGAVVSSKRAKVSKHTTLAAEQQSPGSAAISPDPSK